MRIVFATPASTVPNRGNGVTARRWATICAELGHAAEVTEGWDGRDCDVLVALHARKSHAAAAAFRARHPDRGLVVALTGTDLYGDLPDDPEASASLALADRIVALHGGAAARLPEAARPKVVPIVQSAVAPSRRPTPRDDVFEVSAIGHLRAVKDPFRAVEALVDLPSSSKLRIVHVGGALEPGFEDRARELTTTNPRYRWLGALPFAEAKRVLAASRLTVLSSRAEGGANVIGEAVVCGVPMLASRIDSTEALLGADYPGYFEVGDTGALTRLLLRAESERAFYAALRDRCERLRPAFDPAREREAWAALLAELGA